MFKNRRPIDRFRTIPSKVSEASGTVGSFFMVEERQIGKRVCHIFGVGWPNAFRAVTKEEIEIQCHSIRKALSLSQYAAS